MYSIVGRVGGPEDFKRMEKEQIFVEKALKTIICNNIYNCYVIFKTSEVIMKYFLNDFDKYSKKISQ